VRNCQIVIVSAVKISKQCLQTASALSPRLIPGFAPGPHSGTSAPQPPWATAPSNKNSCRRHCSWGRGWIRSLSLSYSKETTQILQNFYRPRVQESYLLRRPVCLSVCLSVSLSLCPSVTLHYAETLKPIITNLFSSSVARHSSFKAKL